MDFSQYPDVGEITCPECGEIFFLKKKFIGHWGGKHRAGITQNGKPICKFCDAKLVEGVNWAEWAIKQRNLICIPCKRKQNRDSYRKNKPNKKPPTKKVDKHSMTKLKLNRLKERIKNAK